MALRRSGTEAATTSRELFDPQDRDGKLATDYLACFMRNNLPAQTCIFSSRDQTRIQSLTTTKKERLHFMNLIILIVVLVLLFGGGGFYYGGPYYGGGGIVSILVLLLILRLLGII
jgi:hypothetical protein